MTAIMCFLAVSCLIGQHLNKYLVNKLSESLERTHQIQNPQQKTEKKKNQEMPFLIKPSSKCLVIAEALVVVSLFLIGVGCCMCK